MLLPPPGRIGFRASLLGFTTLQVLASPAITKSQAQTVLPDHHLATTVVEDSNNATFQVTGGSQQGSNLFHSFEAFSPADWSVLFDLTGELRGSEIERIFSRVTGEQSSEINGSLSILGGSNPDLFLLNPNGIIFGPDARLNLPGSFIATTAESIQFAEGHHFSSRQPQTTSQLLSISAPVGLQLGKNPAGITVLGSGHNIQRFDSFTPPFQDPAVAVKGLTVLPGKTLALMGGPIRFDGGEIQPVYAPTPDGQVFPWGGINLTIGAVSQGTVQLLHRNGFGWGFGYEGIESYEDIALTNRSWLNTNGLTPSSIDITGHNIELDQGSSISLSNLSDQLTSGDIDIWASGLLMLKGDGNLISDIQNTTFTSSQGGDVNIFSDRLVLSNGAVITSTTAETGDAGAVTIKVAKDLQLDGAPDLTNPTANFTAISASTFGSGDAGTLEVTAQSIVLERGGLILSSSFGAGQGGELKVTGTDSITMSGINPSNLATTAITTASFQSGDSADKLMVKTRNLELRDGASIGSDAFGSGNSGTVVVEASDSVRIGGFSTARFQTPAEISSAVVQDNLGASPFSVGEALGDAGDVIIRTPGLEIFSQGRVTVVNQGSGNAGTLDIQAQQISLVDGAKIVATTQQGEGGLIDVQASESILLRDNSLISANARGQGDEGGGSISIKTPLLVAIPEENSDITANAESQLGTGGEIRIDASSVLGLEVQEQPNRQSGITASARRGAQFNGDITLTQPKRSPISETKALSSRFAAQETVLGRNSCSSNAAQLNHWGRGGLPLGPHNLLHDTLHLAEPSDPINQAIALRNQGFYPQALSLLLAEVTALTQTPESTLERQVIALRQLGITQKLLAQHTASQASLEQSLALALKLEPQALRKAQASATGLSLGNLARAQDDNEKARWHYQQALTGTSDHSLQGQIRANQLALELAEGNDRVAQALLSDVITDLQAHQFDSQPHRQELDSRLNLVATLLRYQQLEQLPNAVAFLEHNLAQAKVGQDEGAIAYALSHLGQAYEQRQQWEKAQQWSQAALQVAQAQQDSFQEYQFAWQLGRITRARWIASKKSQTAWMMQSQSAYQLALAALKQLRIDLATVSPILQFSFRQQIAPVYREYVDLLLSVPADEDSITQPALLKQAIGGIEALHIAELENFLNEGCLETRPQAADQLDAQAAVLYPIVLEDRLEVIVSYQGKLRRHQLAVTAQTLTQTVQSFRNGLVTRSRRSYKQPGQQLYNWLIAPIADDLKADGITTLVVVPDAPLQTTPLGALWSGEQFLIEQFSVVTAPSLQLLPSQGAVSANPQALVAGISQAQAGFASLAHVEQELKAVQERFPGISLVNESFTSNAFGQALLENQAPIVHIATHGQFSSNASETFLLAWDSAINIEQLQQLLKRRAQGTASPIELLVLSACETAAGDQAATLGLAGMAIRSGARSTLASLWSVEDQSTALLMDQFYQQLSQPAASKAQSLQKAQLAMLQDPIYRHPYYWSAFTLMGNWQ